MFDAGYDLDLVNAVLPFELPEQTRRADRPRQLAKCGFEPEDVDARDQLAPALRPLRRQQAPDATRRPTCTATSCARRARPSRSSASATPTRASTTRARSSSCSRATSSSPTGIHLFHTPGHTVGHYSLLVELGGQPPAAVHGRRLLHARRRTPATSRRASTTTRSTACARSAASSGWPRSGTRRSCSPTTWTRSRIYALAPEPFTGGLTAGGGA